MNKPISFKPSDFDSILIEELLSTGKFKNKSDLIRKAIHLLASEEIDKKKHYELIKNQFMV